MGGDNGKKFIKCYIIFTIWQIKNKKKHWNWLNVTSKKKKKIGESTNYSLIFL